MAAKSNDTTTVVADVNVEAQPLARLKELLDHAKDQWAKGGKKPNSAWKKFVDDYQERYDRAVALRAEIDALIASANGQDTPQG